MPKEISQGSIVVTRNGSNAKVVLDPETSQGNAMASAILSEKPPELASPGTLPHNEVAFVVSSRWSVKRIIDGFVNTGRYRRDDPSLIAALRDGKRRGKRSV